MLRTNQERYRRRVTFTVGTKVSQSLKFHHFSTNDRAEFPSNIRISGTSSYFLFTGVHYTKVSSRPRKKDSGGA